jgi:hypothetical protein
MLIWLALRIRATKCYSGRFRSPLGTYEALEVLGWQLFDERFSLWLREVGDEGPGVQVTAWVGHEYMRAEWLSENELLVVVDKKTTRSAAWWVADSWSDVSIRCATR